MKLTNLLALALSLSIGSMSANLSLEDLTPNVGNQRYIKETLKNITVNGCLKLEETTVTEDVLVNGSLMADHSHLKDMIVNGSAVLTDSQVKGPASINGLLTAKETIFSDLLTISSERMTLKNCTLESVKVKKLNNLNKPQVIELTGCSVKGIITFESEVGEVHVLNSKIEESQVKGATIIRY